MKKSNFTFIDLFAGIGGFRQALSSIGGTCKFTSEWDKYCQITYEAWYGEKPYGDIRSIDYSTIPDHDILCAGFPCQPFSIAGVSKKNSLGKSHGFDDVTQGTLFFYLATMIEEKRPPVIFLENVKNLKSHDKGHTWDVIEQRLNDLQYWIFPEIIDASYWVPQHRERIYIVGFDKERFWKKPEFLFPKKPSTKPKLSSILEENPDPKYTLTDHLWNYLQEYSRKHHEKGNGFGFGIADVNGSTRTLSARYYKDGSEILIEQKNNNPRRLTPHECQKLMGFDENKPIVVSDTQAYKQFGNAVVPLVVKEIGKNICDIIGVKYVDT